MANNLARTISTCMALAVLACSKPDSQAADAQLAADAPVPAVDSLEPSPIVDLHVWDGGRVCVLHADGRVACGFTHATELEPPLESLGSAVEIESSDLPVPQLCVRFEQGPVRCLDGKDQVHEIEGTSAARSLESNCAVTSTGGLVCWDESFVAKPAVLPYFPSNDFQRVVLIYEDSPASGGCTLATDGALWCWLDAMETLGVDLGAPVRSGGHADADTYAPVEITDVGNGAAVRELELTGGGVCWRNPGGWMCARSDTSGNPFLKLPEDIDNVVEPFEWCDTHPCNCSFPCWEKSCEPRDLRRRVECEVPQPDERFTVDSHHLSGIVHVSSRRGGQCVVDVNDRVWCQTVLQPLHELAVRG